MHENNFSLKVNLKNVSLTYSYQINLTNITFPRDTTNILI